MAPALQKALHVPSPQAPYTHITRPIPSPGEGDVLVKLEATALNPSEWKLQKLSSASRIIQEYPVMPGTDGAGVVVQVGNKVKGLGVGDKVFFMGEWWIKDRSVYQEYALAAADLLAKVPESMTMAEAASIPLGLATAALGLALPYSPSVQGGAGLKPFWESDAENYYAGKAIVILGGSSAVGQFTIQIAKHMGFSPIVTTASLHNADYLKALGATHVIDRHSDITVGIKEALKESPVDVVFDCVNCPITQREVDLLSPGGTLVSVWVLPTDLKLTQGRRIVEVWGSVHLYKETGRQMYKEMDRLLAEGVIKPMKVEMLEGGLGGVVGGLERIEKGENSAVKLVINPEETK